MDIVVYGKKICILDKNARAYEKMHGVPLCESAVVLYLSAIYHDDIRARVKNMPVVDIESKVNECIKEEAVDLFGEEFYEEA